jgi:gamma-glutamyltranspeptidase/glutathione hydrolase
MRHDDGEPPARPPAVAAYAMAATSQPLATTAALRMLEDGGNAVDAAITAAAVLCVTEPMSTGIGGDLFALLWDDGAITALDAAGPAPAGAPAGADVTEHGPRSVTVPGAVAGWAELSRRHGRRALGDCLAPAIAIAERGYAAGTVAARLWRETPHAPAELGPPPRGGDHVRLPELAATLRAIAGGGPDAFYAGRVAAAIAACSWLEESDLAAYAPRWVEPLRLDYRGVEVLELPPPTQGVAALEGLGILSELPRGTASRVHAVRQALADAFEHVRDGADVSALLERDHLRRRAAAPGRGVPGVAGGTVYACVVDEERQAVSLIQSLFDHFGAGVVAPGTGVALNNRAACFAVAGTVTPGRRPYHTLIPGLLLRDGALLGPFGIMGAFIQAQAHVQFVSALVDDGLDPQAALDRPRFRVEGDRVLLERGLWHEAGALRAVGLEPVLERAQTPFGGGRAILVDGASLVGGSDRRQDGFAAGY